VRLRVNDVDFEYAEIVVRDGKCKKDRVTVLPESLGSALLEHLRVRTQHIWAVRHGYGGVELPHALAEKYKTAASVWAWQYVFPASRPSRDPRSGASGAIICTKRAFSARFATRPVALAF
jgi:integrase